MQNYIGDLLTRIRNGSKSKLQKINIHVYSPKICMYILKVLRDEGYIWGFEQVILKNSNKKIVTVFLKYTGSGNPAIHQIYMISKPGRRIYWTTKALWKPKGFSGILILNTPKGIMTDRDARILNVGGEIICGIY